MACWVQQGDSVDLVVAVPLHTSRLHQRGFNQAWLLGQAFSRSAKLPLLREGLLCRQRATPQQALLAVEDRRRNMNQAFLWQGPNLKGLRLLLVDDVVTSGSTLEACAEVLRKSGAGDVWAITVARAMNVPKAGVGVNTRLTSGPTPTTMSMNNKP
jgi:ComF family protein